MFIDRRFGEYDEKMTLEDKMMKRFTIEKKVWLIETFAWKLQMYILCLITCLFFINYPMAHLFVPAFRTGKSGLEAC